MEGRHVGLDFYDLLIEALVDRATFGQFSTNAVAGCDSLECHRYNVCDFEIRTSISESG
jgi:hypothetical protein